MGCKQKITALLLSAFATVGVSSAATAINEVSAFLVFPSIQASDRSGSTDDVETFVTITNAGSDNIIAHVSFINGDSSEATYCYECDWNVPLSPNDTETLRFTPNGSWTDIVNEDAALVKPEVAGENLTAFGSRTCPYDRGMLTVNVEPVDEVGTPSSDNVLIGSEVVVNYTDGYAYSVPAVSFQGMARPTERNFVFNDAAYSAFPRVIAGDFLAPTLDGKPDADLILFTLNFKRQHPPESDCSLIGYDANEAEFSNSIIFGCWERIDLCQDLDPEFCYGNLGLTGQHEHGWFTLTCEVDSDPDDPSVDPAAGNVHGMIIQRAAAGTLLRDREQIDDTTPPIVDSDDQIVHRDGPLIDPGMGFDLSGVSGSNPETLQSPTGLANAAAWARLLYQSVTTGDPGELELEGPSGGLD